MIQVRSQSLVSWICVVLAAVLTSIVAAPAAADPSEDGWMPKVPQQLSPEQMKLLQPLSDETWSENQEDKAAKWSDLQESGDYLEISCSENRSFPGCEKVSEQEYSKGISTIYYSKDGKYQGVRSTSAPMTLASDHTALVDDEGVLKCASAAGKIPWCSLPSWHPGYEDRQALGAKFDQHTWEFAGFVLEDGSVVTPGQGEQALQGEVVCPGGPVGCAIADLGDALNPAKKVGDMLTSAFAQACETIGKFAGDLLVLSMTWWLRTDSINPTSGDVLAGKEPVQRLVVLIVFLGIIGTAATMALTRRAQPAAELAMGALKFLLISSLAGVVVVGAVHAADDFAAQLVSGGAEEFGPNMKKMLGIATLQNPGGVLAMGLIAMVLSFIQWLIGFARQAALVVLFGLLIFAAAGQMSSWGRQWFPRIVAMMLALILYKPMAACIYVIGFKLMGTPDSLSALMVGLMTIGIAVLSLPTMLSFFAFVTPAAGGGMGTGTVLAGGAMAGAAGYGAAQTFGGGGDAQSSYMDSTGPGSAGGAAEQDPSPGNSAGGLMATTGGGGAGEGGSSETVGSPGTEADLGSDGMGPGSEAPSMPMPGDGGMAGGAAETGGAAGGGAAAAANPYVAGAMAAKAGVDAVGGAVESGMSAPPPSGDGVDDAGPGMQP